MATKSGRQQKASLQAGTFPISGLGGHSNHKLEFRPNARGQVQSIWKYIGSWPIWAQFGLLAALLGSLGISAFEAVKLSIRMIADLVTHYREEKIARFLRLQINPAPQVQDGAGQTPSSHIHCTSVEIAAALNMRSSKVFQLLKVLKEKHRVEQIGDWDSWIVTKREMHDHKGPVTAS